MISEWSSPIRRSGEDALTPIPNELYVKIINGLAPPDGDHERIRDLVQVCLMCRYFAFLAVPLIYHLITLDGRNDASGPTVEYSKFCRMVAQNEGSSRDIANYVRTCRLVGWSVGGCTPRSNFSAPFLELNLGALVYMKNLGRLVLDKVSITRQILDGIGQLQVLKSLEATEYEVPDACWGQGFKVLSSLKLTELVLAPSLVSLDYDWELHESMLEAFDLSCLESLTTSIPSIVDILRRSRGTLPLRTLKILPSDARLRLDTPFFARIPQLRRITLPPSLKEIMVAPPVNDFDHQLSHLMKIPTSTAGIREIEIGRVKWVKLGREGVWARQ